MFRVAIGLLLVALIAAVFGFGGIAGTAAGLAKIIFVVALVLAVVGFLMGGRGTSALAILFALGLPTALAHATGSGTPGSVVGSEVGTTARAAASLTTATTA